MEVKNVMVVGVGTMGAGIAQAVVQAGFNTTIFDVDEAIVKKCLKMIEKNLDRYIKQDRLDEKKKKEILERIKPTTDMSKGKEVDYVIEAAPEEENLKKKILGQLDEICPKHTILASNTSTIPITRLGAATKRPAQVIGMHFTYPAHYQKLLEIIRSFLTSDETFALSEKLGRDLGKELIVSKDYPGFLTVRQTMLFLNESAYLLVEGIGTKEDIDKSSTFGLGHPMGPFELLDTLGIDTAVKALTFLHQSLGDPKFFPCPLLTQMVEAGHIGKKRGKGFYDYTEEAVRQ